MNVLQKPLELPCGVWLKNRLVKSAMSDSLGDGCGNPTKEQMRLYARWAEGGASLSLIGEVQITPDYPEKPGNLVLGSKSNASALKALASHGARNDTHIWPQLGHAGALSHAPISTPKGPSALNVEGLKCDGMTQEEVAELPEQYARAANLAKEMGFGGVQIHAGHGFLLSQFLSPLFNKRNDRYGGTIEARFSILGEIIEMMRKSVGEKYPIGIKINSTDKLVGGLTQEDALEIVSLLDKTSIDIIDVSGGTYFPGAVSSSDAVGSDGPYFIEFARRAKEITSIPVVATGGFETMEQAVKSIESGYADAVSLARAMIIRPDIANKWLGNNTENPNFPVFQDPPKGSITAWYSMLLSALAEDRENEFNLTPQQALQTYNRRDAERCKKWMRHFS